MHVLGSSQSLAIRFLAFFLCLSQLTSETQTLLPCQFLASSLQPSLGSHLFRFRGGASRYDKESSHSSDDGTEEDIAVHSLSSLFDYMKVSAQRLLGGNVTKGVGNVLSRWRRLFTFGGRKQSKAGAVKDDVKRKSKKLKSSSKEKHVRVTKTTAKVTKMKATNPLYRIQRELSKFTSDPPTGLSAKSKGNNLRVWVITMQGQPNTIYDGETFKLRVEFPKDYPSSPPSAYFIKGHIPQHEHVYTNGDICLSLLGKDWRPTMTAESIAISILSILASAKEKLLPPDNSMHSGRKAGQAQDNFIYHDDNC